MSELAFAWAAVAEDGDLLWDSNTQQLTRDEAGGAGPWKLQTVSSQSGIPAETALVPWGWTEEVIYLGRQLGAVVDPPPLEAVRLVNSRRFSHNLELEHGVGLSGAAAVVSIEELFAAIRQLPDADSGWVVKAEFSNSSRERFLHVPDPINGKHAKAPVSDALVRWAKRRFRMGQSLFIEPWVDRLDEIGIQLTVPRNGEPRLEGVTRMLVDEAGRYRGSEFTPALDDEPEWQPAVRSALAAARSIQQTGYFGPLGIDAMRYRDAAGDIRLRPLQDINARWTMGRLSLGLRRLLPEGERGLLLQGQHRTSANHNVGEFDRHVREFALTPPCIGGRPVQLQTIVRFVRA